MRQVMLGLVVVCLLLSASGDIWAQEGGAWGWGGNPVFGLGHNGNSSFLEEAEYIDVPYQAGSISDVHAMAGDYYVKSDGTVWQYGFYNEVCEYLPEPVMAYDETYGEVPLTDIVAVSAGGGHLLALASDGTVWTWGDNTYGQLGYSGTFPDRLARQVPNVVGIVEIAAGGSHCVALDDQAMRVWTWGCNSNGQLGIGSVDNNAHATPQYISLASQETTPEAIGAGVDHTLIVGADMKVYACGNNDAGQLGVWEPGVYGNCSTPTTVKYLDEFDEVQDWEGFLAVAGGNGFSVGIAECDATTAVYAWGISDDGQAGASGGVQEYPVQITILGGGAIVGVDQVVAGSAHAMARVGDVVWAWGWDGMGQLGAQAGGGSTEHAIQVLMDDVQWIASSCTSNSSRAIASNPIELSLTFDWNWSYCNTQYTTQDRHKSVLTVTVVSDPGGSGTYEVDVMETPWSNDSFSINSTGSIYVWNFVAGRRPAPDVAAYYDFIVHVRNTTARTQALVVQADLPERRVLADVTAEGDVTAMDKYYLNCYLNGYWTPYPSRCYDFDGDGVGDAADLLIINRILNGLSIP